MSLPLFLEISSIDSVMPVVGILAAILTTSSFLPQIIKGHRTKKMDDLSHYLMLMYSSGTLLWMVYGVFRNDPVIIGANAVASGLNVVLLGMKFSYRKKSKTTTTS